MTNDSKRRSIEVEGFGHGGQPIPAASRIGNIIMTGGVSGMDMATQKFSGDPADQCRHMFANLERILAAAGASAADIVKLTVYVKDRSVRESVNPIWLQMFPDEHSRPARHTLVYDLPGEMVIQCEATAVLT